jgi:hypothetical protein
MKVTRYYRDGRPWDQEVADMPTWAAVEAAIRRMDNFCVPIVELNPTDEEDSRSMFEVVGGAGRWALFNIMGRWQYTDPAGGNEEVRLQDSDQGYFCAAKHVLTDIEKVLRITRMFYETGSYDGLDTVD